MFCFYKLVYILWGYANAKLKGKWGYNVFQLFNKFKLLFLYNTLSK